MHVMTFMGLLQHINAPFTTPTSVVAPKQITSTQQDVDALDLKDSKISLSAYTERYPAIVMIVYRSI